MIQKAKKVIPSILSYSRYFFSHMAVVGNLSTHGDLMSKHIDKNDFITVLFHIGQLLHGDGTDYYTGLTSDWYGTLTKHIPCQHGRVTIGCSDKIIHSGEVWEGTRECINFNLEKKFLNIF